VIHIIYIKSISEWVSETLYSFLFSWFDIGNYNNGGPSVPKIEEKKYMFD
jgi:hypothetical protein